MKNNKITAIIILVFVAGFILGKTLNNTGRYVHVKGANSTRVFDSKTGVFYLKDNYGNFKKVNMMKGTVEQFKAK